MAVAAVAEAAQAVALVPVPEDSGVCLAEAEELSSARDRITSALAARVGRVHRAGEAKSHGHASTKLWLRSAGGMTPAGAGRLLTMSMELVRLHEVRRLFAEGGLPEGIVEVICIATSGLTDDQATTAERILLQLAGSAGAAEVAKAGRYLRAVLDPDGHEKDEQADFDRRFFRVRRRRNGAVEGEFCLPVEAAARLRHLLDNYAKPKADGDDRTQSMRNADAFIAFLENKIVTELLVLVNAESLPDDPPADDPPAEDAAAGHPADSLAGTAPARTATVPRAGGDRSADDGGCSAVAPCAVGDDASAAAAAGGQEPVTGRAATGDSPIGDPASAPPLLDPTGSDEHGDLRACDDIQQSHADDPGAHDQESERGHRSNRAWRPQQARQQQAHAPDPPAEHDAPPGAEHGGGTWLGDDTRPGGEPWPGSYAWAGPGADAPPGAEHGGPSWASGGAWPGGTTWPGGDGWLRGGRAGVGGSVPPGVWLRGLPGLILATGHLLPVVSVHRLARTSTLVRVVMNAAGQVLDMGRKVRLATPAQRRAVFARYATCWVEGCPLPATMCQIDHAEDWCSGGLTDLKLLGPACQFHNRDRYRNSSRYTRRKVGDDRWAFTYQNPRTTRRRM
ncbi:DUF222 domain-containing protein [Microbispora cellulosiformans]|uniref:DUF222 domain-containing protein n=1 Tax=Microbispora cellulosiformans TaxID=2614688 RepID=A0A5J5K362_9ACTN|nr:DUF222 domain-containing protein [Microbispora cellulosiformans]